MRQSFLVFAGLLLTTQSSMAASAYLKTEPAVETRIPITEYRDEIQQYTDTCPVVVFVPAHTENCGDGAKSMESFDDFEKTCRIVPAHNDVRQESCTKTRTVSVPYTTYKIEYSCPYERFVHLKQRASGEWYCSLI
ncbi:hypothetical protein [Mesorhizobium sp. SP-1A]|uniref:hypothetical protein n=1 Tax=Mesorhizobium sp. SP-1A TaxID=3077840 RepID=UPI0028F6E46B|nr:hypothetical protein [Mesorhizobium sp. SP-1A]